MFETELSVNGKSVGSTLNISKAVGAALSRGRVYGEYMILYCDDGVRELRALVADANFNPRTPLFVTRTVTVNEGAFKIKYVALSADGYTDDVYLDEINAYKTAGEPLTVSVTVRFSLTRDCAALTSGTDNNLAKWLLFGGSVASAQIGVGRNRNLLGAAPPPSADFIEMCDAEVAVDDSKIEFSAVVKERPYEACLIFDGTTAMRARPLAGTVKPAAASGRVSNYGSFVFSTMDILEVVGVSMGSTVITDFTVKYGRNHAGGAVKLPFKAPRATRIVSDGACSLAAVVGGGEAMLLKPLNGDIVCAGRRSFGAPDDTVRLTRDGTLFTLVGDKLTVMPQGGRPFEATLTPADDYAVVYKGDRHLIGLRIGDLAQVYTLKDGEISLTETYELGESGAVGNTDGRRLTLAGKDIGCKVIGGKSASTTETFVASLFEKYAPKRMKMDSGMLLFEADDGTVYGVEYIFGDGNPMDSGFDDTVFGGEVIISGESMYVSDISGGIDKIPMPSSSQKEVSACRLGEFVVRLLADGALDFIPLCGSGAIIESDMFTPRASVTYTYLAPAVTDNGNGTRVVMTVQFLDK